MEHVKVNCFRAGRGKQANRERDKTEADIALPNGGRHSQLDSIWRPAVSLCHRMLKSGSEIRLFRKQLQNPDRKGGATGEPFQHLFIVLADSRQCEPHRANQPARAQDAGRNFRRVVRSSASHTVVRGSGPQR